MSDSQSNLEPDFKIKVATEAQEREAIYQFRYNIYVEEMGRVQTYADHQQRIIREPLDDTGVLFSAYESGLLIGTARMNYSRASNLDYYADFYEMSKVGHFHPLRTAITTKFMIKPEYRGGTLAFRLTTALYAQAIKNRIRYIFIDVNDHLVDFFSKLGSHIHKTGNHPEYGDVTVMLLDMEDINLFEKLRSPFRKEYHAYFNSHKLVTD